MEELACAKCRGHLEEVEVAGFTVDRCDQCRGLFFGGGELVRVLTDGKQATVPSEAASRGAVASAGAMDALEATCPRCQIPMERLAGGEGPFAYDFCSACHGLWLDAGELAQLEHANVAVQQETARDVETRRRRAAAVVEQLEGLIVAVERQRDDRLARLDKLVTLGLNDAGEIRAIRGAIEAETRVAREALGHGPLFEEARRLCIEGHITGAQFESIREHVVPRPL